MKAKTYRRKGTKCHGDLKSTLQPARDVPSTPQPAGYVPSTPQRANDVPSTPQPADLPPFEEVLDAPPPLIARALFDTPLSVHSDSAIVFAASMATVVSLIWRIKRLPRIHKVPIKFSDYSHSMVHSGYVLND
ncbi:hypothetical protein AAC387_Pa09g0804 [Persea americana]